MTVPHGQSRTGTNASPMPFKRPRPPLRPQASSSSSLSRSGNHKIARRDERALLSNIKIHIVPAKLPSDTIEQLASLIHDADAISCGHPEEADVLVTGIHMRKRLERHVNWEIAVSHRVGLDIQRVLPINSQEREGSRYP